MRNVRNVMETDMVAEVPTLITQDYMLGTILYIRDSLEGIRSIMRDEPDTMHVDVLLQQVRREVERLESGNI